MLQVFRSKIFLIAAGLALLVGLYALAGFVLAPKMLRSALIENCQKLLHLTPTFGEIHLNPFKLQLDVRDFAIPDRAGVKLLGFDRFFVDVELASLWRRAMVFKDIELIAPYVNASVAPDGSVNLMQLKPQTEAPAPAPKPGKSDAPLPKVEVGSLRVSKGVVAYQDRSRPTPFATRLEPINFELHQFTTGVEGGQFMFTGASKLGERLEWHGHLTVQPVASDGELRVDGLRAHTLWEYLEDSVGFVIDSGTIDLQAKYHFSLKDDVDLTVALSKLTLNTFGLKPKGVEAEWLKIPTLTVSDAALDLKKRDARVDWVSITGLYLSTWLEPDGTLNLQKLAGAKPAAATAHTGSPGVSAAAAPTTATVSTTAAARTTTPAPAAGRPWQFSLREFDLRDANITAEDRTRNPVVKLSLTPLSLKVTGASLDLTKPLAVVFDTHVNGAGELAADGDVTPQPVSANVHVKLKQIDLTTAQPYIAQFTSMTLLHGSLGGDAKIRYGAKKPSLVFAGGVSVEKLHTVDTDLRNDFVNWDRLDVVGLNFQHDPDRLDIDKVVAHQAYARVIIEPDQSLNVKKILTAPGAAPVAAVGPAGKQETAAAKPPTTDEAGPKVASVKPAPANAMAAKSATAAAGSNSMPISIKKIVVEAAQANFSDLSVKPNFSTGIQKLDGTIVGLSSRVDSRAKIDLHGQVDEFSPVAITGDANVLGSKLYTDLALSFRNMELTTFNPYSGKFAGYNITKGKLTTELHYKVDDRKLDAQHHIIIDQLEFGAKTASKDAVSLPVKLAVALLKDRNGVIDLNLPVNGTLDDPQFRLGPIIWKVLLNLLVKAVTAPFALIGSLFGGGPDMQFVDFPAGSASLDAAATDKMKSLTKALIDRPQLKLELPIAADPELDRPALIEAKYQSELKEQSAAPNLDELDPAKKLAALTKLYVKDLKTEPEFPEAVTGLKSKPEVVAAKIDFLVSDLHAHLAIGDEELKALATMRATALQQAILSDTQVDPTRIFLVVNDKVKSQSGHVRLELALQ